MINGRTGTWAGRHSEAPGRPTPGTVLYATYGNELGMSNGIKKNNVSVLILNAGRSLSEWRKRRSARQMDGLSEISRFYACATNNELNNAKYTVGQKMAPPRFFLK